MTILIALLSEYYGFSIKYIKNMTVYQFNSCLDCIKKEEQWH